MQGVKATINREQILELASRFWTISQIAAFFSVSERTVYNYAAAEDIRAAKELGRGHLISLAWDRAKTDSKILVHLLQFYREEVVQLKARLIDASNEELLGEVQKRVAASQLVKSGKWQEALIEKPEVQVLLTSEATDDGEPVVSTTERSEDPDQP